jgi:hypothetical protein
MRSIQAMRHILRACAGAALVLGGSVIAVQAYPQPLFAYYIEHGRLQLYSDQPFDAGNGRRVLADVERRIANSPLDERTGVHRIFVANASWRRRLVFLWADGAGGVNFGLTRNVFIRPADIDADRVMSPLGTPVAPPRTLAYFAAHEIGHSLISERIGSLANWRLPVWIREGLADYIGFAGKVDIEALTRALRADEIDLHPKRSGLYARYRLLVAYFLDREGFSVDQLLVSNMSQPEAEQRLLARVPR